MTQQKLERDSKKIRGSKKDAEFRLSGEDLKRFQDVESLCSSSKKDRVSDKEIKARILEFLRKKRRPVKPEAVIAEALKRFENKVELILLDLLDAGEVEYTAHRKLVLVKKKGS